MTQEQNTAEEPEQTVPPPDAHRPRPAARSRAGDEGSENAPADERRSPFPYAESFAEWVADETATPDRPAVHGAEPLPGAYETRPKQLEAARTEARRRTTEHVIHNEDGSIAERNSYGNDPADRPG